MPAWLASSSKLCRPGFPFEDVLTSWFIIENASSLEIPWYSQISTKTTPLEIPGRQHLSIHFGRLCRLPSDCVILQYSTTPFFVGSDLVGAGTGGHTHTSFFSPVERSRS
jgi:hypothetical protein